MYMLTVFFFFVLFCLLRDSPNLLLDEIIGFTVPEWMCEKMKLQMAAMRTDVPKPKVANRSRSGTPDTRTLSGAGQVSREANAKLPFSAFSSNASKQVVVEVKTEVSSLLKLGLLVIYCWIRKPIHF